MCSLYGFGPGAPGVEEIFPAAFLLAPSLGQSCLQGRLPLGHEGVKVTLKLPQELQKGKGENISRSAHMCILVTSMRYPYVSVLLITVGSECHVDLS